MLFAQYSVSTCLINHVLNLPNVVHLLFAILSINVCFELECTMLEGCLKPCSGGDWSIHRGAAFLATNAQHVEVVGCRFNQTGGNAVLLSGNCTNSTVSHCEFVHTGDSAIVLLGLTDAIDATKQTYPNHNLIANNHIREVGVYGKQTSCIFHALAANTTVRENVCYNGPRSLSTLSIALPLPLFV